MTTNNQKPFGLQIACNLAVKAIKEGKSPPSTVLYNLLYLQQEVNFPKDLDTDYFNKPCQANSELGKRLVVKLIDEIKKPQINLSNLLESSFETGWIKKKSFQAIQGQPSFTKFKINKPKSKINKNPTEPVVIIKKSKLTS